MEVFRIDRDVRSRVPWSAGIGPLVHRLGDGAWVFSGATRKLLDGRWFRRLETVPHAVDPEAWAEARGRLLDGWASVVGDPLPDDVRDEVVLYLYAHPAERLRYQGRGMPLHERSLPGGDRGNLLFFDVPGGRRRYLLRRVPATPDERDRRFDRRMEVVQRWLDDDGSKLVVSLGGGGFRMFAATPVLKVIDAIVKDRRRVAEVWGSSGGAFLGWCYSRGFSPEVIDDFGYDLYHGRGDRVVNGSLRSIARMGLRSARGMLLGVEEEPEMARWTAAIEKKQPQSERHPVIPYYATATNMRAAGLKALAHPQDAPEFCHDFLVPCDPVAAAAASTAVPFVVPSVSGIGEDARDLWVDGSITQENPLTLPYLKWRREQKHLPGAPKRLKLVLVKLNLRSSEIGLVRGIGRLPVLDRYGVVNRTARVIDTLMDSATDSSILLMTAHDDVEVLTVTMHLRRLAIVDPGNIPRLIRSGRAHESWEVAIHPRRPRPEG